MSVFLPFVENPEDQLIGCLSRLGPLLVTAELYSTYKFPDFCTLQILVENPNSVTSDQLFSWLDGGIQNVIVPLSKAKELIGVLPRDRLLLLLDAANVSAVSESVRNGVSGVLLKTPAINIDLITSVSRFFPHSVIHVLPTIPSPPSESTIREVFGLGASLVIPTSQLSLSPSTTDRINVANAFLAAAVTDRPDGLFPTIVTSHKQGDTCLGLVYSSFESVKESIVTGKGVYQSRKHGLWRKGETSGSVQDVVKIRLDCDSDALQFSVIQHGEGFCHLGRTSCFGRLSGLSALEQTLRTRLENAPEGSYTARLFHDPSLLQAKIMEEADELCSAKTPDEVAFEAADLFYFSLARCIAAGVGLSDIERSLDRKAKKVTRRKGDAKPQWSITKPQTPQVPATPKPVDLSAPIRMQTFDISSLSVLQRAELLKRPVLRSTEMISKVKPIVDDVRMRGDAALLELTAKFDKAQLSTPVIFPPFTPQSMQLDDTVRSAIDMAYLNIKKFHQAQAEKDILVVETMPGVVCSRFARPISRVGLYVPGGTAILPSTALMLGIPAQVAGCKEIVLATPPRPDGSISPEVMYVAHLIGASVVLKAGGAQAVAAMAYGTQTVPKVDKVFGPGNQWVTAAKMLVQNDTDALVSIDMPAGPSEVLVIADQSCNPAFVAADLLSQAEHGADSQVVLITVDLPDSKITLIEKEIDSQARALDRVDIMRQSIPKSIILKVSNVKQALEFSNDYAPEHLILHLTNASEAVSSVQNAGSVFVGPYSPESCGDYASGTNHTLPTNGYARQFSGVNTQSFQKHITSQEVTAEGLKGLGPIVATLADCEGLGAHANAVRIRLESFNY